MTNFELITQNIQILSQFISAVQDDALEAGGCSVELKLPYELGDDIRGGWPGWLKQENKDDCIYLSPGQTIERLRKRGEDDG